MNATDRPVIASASKNHRDRSHVWPVEHHKTTSIPPASSTNASKITSNNSQVCCKRWLYQIPSICKNSRGLAFPQKMCLCRTSMETSWICSNELWRCGQRYWVCTVFFFWRLERLVDLRRMWVLQRPCQRGREAVRQERTAKSVSCWENCFCFFEGTSL